MMIPSKTKIESFAKRCHMGTLGGKGLMNDYCAYVCSRWFTYFLFLKRTLILSRVVTLRQFRHRLCLRCYNC